jgi:carboxypeptidase family protein
MKRVILPALVAWVLMSGTGLAQQLAGTVSGVVRDAQGGVLPGASVTLTGTALIGGARTGVTSEAGAFRFADLPPGMFDVTFELAGFTTMKQQGIRVQVAQNTRVDAQLGIGAVSETVTVSGDSPIVDVSTNTTQTNIDKELFDAIPTSRNPWVLAALAPGVVAGRLDVGGTEAMQQYNLEAYGSADSQKTFSVDGLKMNWSGASGGSTNQYYSSEMFDEYNMQTASGTAEVDSGGVYMNMVTRSGSNRFLSESNVYFMNDRTQGDNIDDQLRQRLGIAPGARAAAAGNPIDNSYDWSATLGGPVLRDRLWFFSSFRWFRLDQFQIGAVNPDGSLGIDDNRIRAGMVKGTYQATPNTRVSYLMIPHLKERFHRRNAPFFAIPDKATVNNPLDTNSFVSKFNHVLGKSMVVDVSVGRIWGTFANRYQKDVGPDDITVEDTVRSTRFNAAPDDQNNPNHRNQLNAGLVYFTQNLLGSHNFKFGGQMSREQMLWEKYRNGDITLQLRDGVAFQALLANTPNTTDHRINSWGVFAQDHWAVGRTSLNVGVRVDGAESNLPAQHSAAGIWVGERSFPRTQVFDFPLNVAPRLGVAYDVFGSGRTAVKAYYGRFYYQFGSDIPEAVNPNAITTVQVPWSDSNNNRGADPGELNLSTFVGFPAGLFPRVADAAKRPYSDQTSVGVEHQLVRDLSVGVSYHRTEQRDGMTIVDLARPASAYTPLQRTYTDGGATQTITVYNLDPALRTARNRIITNADILKSTFNGVEIHVTKKMSNRWQMLGGVEVQRHEGFAHSGTFTNTGANTDFNNPNYVLNRDTGAVFSDLPWAFRLAGSYQLPYNLMVAGKYQARAGEPLERTLVVTGLNQGSDTVYVQPRGVDRTETVAHFADLRLSKRFDIGTSRLEAAFDLYNIFNVNPVLAQNVGIGSTLGVPTRILAPRVIRLGLSARF